MRTQTQFFSESSENYLECIYAAMCLCQLFKAIQRNITQYFFGHQFCTENTKKKKLIFKQIGTFWFNNINIFYYYIL